MLDNTPTSGVESQEVLTIIKEKVEIFFSLTRVEKEALEQVNQSKTIKQVADNYGKSKSAIEKRLREAGKKYKGISSVKALYASIMGMCDVLDVKYGISSRVYLDNKEDFIQLIDTINNSELICGANIVQETKKDIKGEINQTLESNGETKTSSLGSNPSFTIYQKVEAFFTLVKREKEVLEQVNQGTVGKIIAPNLCISVSALESRLQRAKEKCEGISDPAALYASMIGVCDTLELIYGIDLRYLLYDADKNRVQNKNIFIALIHNLGNTTSTSSAKATQEDFSGKISVALGI